MPTSDFLTALGTGSGLPRAVCAPTMTLRFTEVRCAAAHMGAALQGIFVGQGPRALPGSAGTLGSGRCRQRPLRKHYCWRGGAGDREGWTCRLRKISGDKYGDGLPRAVCAPTMTLHKDHGAWRRKIAQAGLYPACAHNLMRFIWADQSRRTAVPLAVTISMPLSAPRTS